MQHIVSITTQGQLTVPASVRRKLGITHSTKAIVEQRGGSFVVTPKRDFWSLPGSLAKGVSLTDEELEHATSLFEKNWAMNEKLVDTNVIIRLLQKDGTAEQFAQAKKWFLQAEQKEISLKIPTIVVAETCYVLESFYLHDRPTIVATMSVLLSQSWIEVPGRTILQNSWRWYMQGFHFVDSMLLSEAEYKNYDIATFDKKVATAVKGFELSKAY